MTAVTQSRACGQADAGNVVRRAAGADRPTGDQFWSGHRPRVTASHPAALLLGEPEEAAALDVFELAAACLADCPTISHPSWCDPVHCEVEERGVVHHRREIGSVPCAPFTAGAVGVVIEVTLERFDNLTQDGERWEVNPEHPVLLHTELFNSPVSVDSLTLLSGPAAGRLGELLTIARQHLAGCYGGGHPGGWVRS